MKAKWKPTYEQALALQRGQQTARANQRARAARAAETTEPEHEHRYGDWTCRGVANRYEKRYCECGAFQAREFRL